MATRQVLVDVPEKVLLAAKTDEVSFARELSTLAAVKLYELGRLSSGRAAELAGVSRVEFLLELARYKVFPFEAELLTLEKSTRSLPHHQGAVGPHRRKSRAPQTAGT